MSYVYRNPLIAGGGWHHWRAIWGAPYQNNYAPVTLLSYALDFQTFGMQAAGSHAVNILQRRGWRVAGTEVAATVTGRTHRRRLGVPILPGDFTVLRWRPARFDIVTLWHVLEHLPSPRATLRQARRVLRPDGWLLVSVPDLASWQARCFGARWLHLNPPLHLAHFTPATLQRLLTAAGFAVARVRHLHVLWMHNLWGWLQGCLDAVVPERQALFLGLQRAWRSQLAARPWPRRVGWWCWFAVSVVLAVPLAPVCLALMCAESWAKAGGTIVVLARPAPAGVEPTGEPS